MHIYAFLKYDHKGCFNNQVLFQFPLPSGKGLMKSPHLGFSRKTYETSVKAFTFPKKINHWLKANGNWKKHDFTF